MIINGDSIKPSDGTNIIGVSQDNVIGVNGRGLSFKNDGVTFTYRPGSIIESLWSICDGSTHTVRSGTYTVQNVTAQQSFNNSWSDINGSVIAYQPPPGTSKVIYRFTYANYWVSGASTHGISHHKFLIDNIDVNYSRHNRSASSYSEMRYTFEWIIFIGDYDDRNTGRQATWTSLKTLKMQSRDYADGTHEMNANGTYYWDGGGGVFNMPIINVISVA